MSEAVADAGVGAETAQQQQQKAGMQKLLDSIERIGNKVPHPAIIFLALCGIVILLSALFSWMGVHVTYESATPPGTSVDADYLGGSVVPGIDSPPHVPSPDEYKIHTETTAVESLLSGDGIRFLFTSAIQNFNDFGVVAVILVAMIGVGVAEEAGLIAALIRKLVGVAPAGAITFIIVLVGMLSSIASDAGYLVLIPLGAVVFRSLGRNPLAGIAAAFAGVSAGFAVNFLIAPFDAILTEITNESIQLVQPGHTIQVTANLYWGIGSTILITAVITLLTERIVEKGLGPWDAADAAPEAEALEAAIEVPAGEARGLRFAFWGFLGVMLFIGLLGVPSGAPLRNPKTGALFGDSPLMQSLIFLIMLVFLVTGLCYGQGAGTMKTSTEAIAAITKTFAGLGGLIFLLLIIAQFIAYFNYSNMATIAAVKMADWLEHRNIGALWLLVGLILVVTVLNLIIPGVMPKWAIFAPIFIPLFLRLGVAPQTVLAAYRVGDGPTNVITPLMVYLPFIVLLVQRYKKSAGVGTVVSMMLPYTVVLVVTWTAFYIAWYLIGIPWGPGAPVHS